MGKKSKKGKGGKKVIDDTKVARKEDAFNKSANAKKRTKKAQYVAPKTGDGAATNVSAPRNPFTEIQNKRRSTVLGQKVRGAKRNVQKSRQEQAFQRADQLLDEIRGQHRTSTFQDARFGESMDFDERMMKRFEKEQKKKAKKASFSLQDENITLTHGGKSLFDFTKKELRGEDFDEELDSEGEREAMEALTDTRNRIKTKEEIYAEIIAKSKQRKKEAKQEKEKQEEELEGFEADFKDILSELHMRPTGKFNAEADKFNPVQTEQDKAFDLMTKTLGTERKVQATDRLKTPEERAKEKANRLAELEKEREDRKKGIMKKKEGHQVAPLQKSDSEEDEEKDEDVSEGEEGSDDDADETTAPEDDMLGISESGSESEGEGEEDDDESEDEKSVPLRQIPQKENKEVKKDNLPKKKEEKEKDGKNEPSEKELMDLLDQLEKEQKGEKDPNAVDDVIFDVDFDDTEIAGPVGELKLPPHKEFPPFFRAADDLDPMINEKGEEHLPFTVKPLTTVKSYESLVRKFGVEAIAKLIRRSLVAARSEAPSMVIPFFDFIQSYAEVNGFGIIYATECIMLEFVKDHPKIIFPYFSKKVEGMGELEAISITQLTIAKIAVHIFPTTDLWHPILTSLLMLLDHWAVAISTWEVEEEKEDFREQRQLSLVLFGLIHEYTHLAKRYGPHSFTLAARFQSPYITKVCRQIAQKFEVPPMSYVDLDEGARMRSLVPLRLHHRPGVTPQIKMLDPVFHNPMDGPLPKGDPLRNEKLKLRRQLNNERRAAARNLRRDQGFLQLHKTKTDTAKKINEATEKKRIRRIMDVEDRDIKKLKSEFAGMDTSLGSYSKNKDKKKANKRLAGGKTNATEGRN